jgi:hypothetical protein
VPPVTSPYFTLEFQEEVNPLDITIPADLIWWEQPTTAQQEIDDLEFGPRVHYCFDLRWTYVDGIGWVDQ